MPVKTMARPSLSAAAITFSIVDGAAGLDDGGCAGGGDGFKAVGEGEEGVGGGDAACEREDGLHGAEAGGVDAAHLAGADADGLAVAGVDDGVGLDVLADAPGEEQAAQFFGGGRTPGFDVEFGFGDAGAVGVLQQEAAGDVLDDGAGGRGWTSTRRRFFLAAKRSRASAVKAGAAMASTKSLAISSAAAASTSRLMPMTPPKAETGSQARAFS